MTKLVCPAKRTTIIVVYLFLTKPFKMVEVSKVKTSKKGLQRPAGRYDGIGKIRGGYGKACCCKLQGIHGKRMVKLAHI